jgi:hypothetical protein
LHNIDNVNVFTITIGKRGDLPHTSAKSKWYEGFSSGEGRAIVVPASIE